MSNVVPLDKGYAPASSEPNEFLIEGLKVLLAEAAYLREHALDET